ncbi:MAG: hypothetical protein GX205_04795 [Firmicutes bacterium]|nr:hypothetical protein [Bacillota bacterium]
MGWKWVIPRFRFEPSQLRELAEQLASQIPDGESLLEERRPEESDLREILEELRRIGEAEIERESGRFSTRDVDLLCYGFLQILDSDPAKPVAAKLLLHRWKTRYGRVVWRHFQTSYADRCLRPLVVRGVSEGKLGQSPKAAGILLSAMESEDPVGYLASTFASRVSPYLELIQLYRINEDSPLALELLRQYFLQAFPELYRTRETPEFIKSSLDEFWHRWKEDYRRVIDNYLQMFDEFEDGDFVLIHALDHLGRPDEVEGRRLWEGISEESKGKFMKWLEWRTVVDFFDRLAHDSERIEFWRMFKTNLEDARIRDAGNTKAILLVFPHVAVIEFMDVGHAAYVYSRDFYEQRVATYASGALPIIPSTLKYKGAYLFRICHSGDWQGKYYQKLSELIR